MALAQSASDRQSVDVIRPGRRIACLCNACSATLATCPMLECGFGKPAKEKIFKMQHAGVSDAAIVDEFVKEYGPQIYRNQPSIFGRLIPYLAILPGLLMIWWFMRRYYRPRAAIESGPVPDDPALARYNAQIEKELTQLD